MIKINRLIDYDELSDEEINKYFSKLFIKKITMKKSNVNVVDTKLMILIFSKNVETPYIKLNKEILRENIKTDKFINEENIEKKKKTLRNILISTIVRKNHKICDLGYQFDYQIEKIIIKSNPPKENQMLKEAQELDKLGSKTLFKMAIGDNNWDKFLKLRAKANL